MPFTASGKYYVARAKRWCKRCGEETEQDMVMNRMRCKPQPIVPLTYIREQEWYCTQCDNIEQVKKEVTELTDKQRIVGVSGFHQSKFDYVYEETVRWKNLRTVSADYV